MEHSLCSEEDNDPPPSEERSTLCPGEDRGGGLQFFGTVWEANTALMAGHIRFCDTLWVVNSLQRAGRTGLLLAQDPSLDGSNHFQGGACNHLGARHILLLVGPLESLARCIPLRVGAWASSACDSARWGVSSAFLVVRSFCVVLSSHGRPGCFGTPGWAANNGGWVWHTLLAHLA